MRWIGILQIYIVGSSSAHAYIICHHRAMTAVHPKLASCRFGGQAIEGTSPDLVRLGPDARLWSSLITVMSIVLISCFMLELVPEYYCPVIRSSLRVRRNASNMILPAPKEMTSSSEDR
jgi:hypothetical protein